MISMQAIKITVAGETIETQIKWYVPHCKIIEIETPRHSKCDLRYFTGGGKPRDEHGLNGPYGKYIGCYGASHSAPFRAKVPPSINFPKLYELFVFAAPRLTLLDCVQIADEHDLFPFTNVDVLLWLSTQEFNHAQR